MGFIKEKLFLYDRSTRSLFSFFSPFGKSKEQEKKKK